ncbi:hypothetical protein [Porphyromonas macacae]|uniref:hypothetical protein n=1 Tax=Porphyromonas macacae TaxID=28115 RepID=UPI001F5AF085|nr:hypothetical protein [Porphyromonas macacae]
MSSDRNTALKSYLFYIFLLILFAGGLWATLHFGADYIPHSETVLGSGRFLNESFNQFMDGVSHHMSSTIGLLLLQILVILAVARLMGWLFTKMRQRQSSGKSWPVFFWGLPSWARFGRKGSISFFRHKVWLPSSC